MGNEWNCEDREPHSENAQEQTPPAAGQQAQQREFAQGGQQSQFDRQQSGQEGFSDQETQGNQGSFSGGSETPEQLDQDRGTTLSESSGKAEDSETLTRPESGDLENLGQTDRQDSGFIGSQGSGNDDYLQEDTQSDFAERDSLNQQDDGGMGLPSSQEDDT